MKGISQEMQDSIRKDFVKEKRNILYNKYLGYRVEWNDSETLTKKMYCQTYENIEDVLRELENSGGLALIGVVEEYFIDRTKYLDGVIERFGG